MVFFFYSRKTQENTGVSQLKLYWTKGEGKKEGRGVCETTVILEPSVNPAAYIYVLFHMYSIVEE